VHRIFNYGSVYAFHQLGKLSSKVKRGLRSIPHFASIAKCTQYGESKHIDLERFVGLDAPCADPDEVASWILYEDDAVIAVNKPGWLVCHPSKNGPFSSLAGAIKAHCGLERLHLVSRLDRETSGIVLIAKHKRAASQYQKAVEQRRVEKSYLVWLMGKMAEPVEVDQPLARDMESPVYVKQTVRKSNSAQSARTQFRPLCYSADQNLTLARVNLLTGRKHQIRAHAQWLGYPVLGDKIYGPDDRLYLEFIETGWTDKMAHQLRFPRQALHAYQLKFEGIEYCSTFEAPLTADLLALCEWAQLDPPGKTGSR
jgi:23S rRNA pseudouridine1911/1915/1917 synthase